MLLRKGKNQSLESNQVLSFSDSGKSGFIRTVLLLKVESETPTNSTQLINHTNFELKEDYHDNL